MQQLVLVRFGDRPNPIVSIALAPHIVGQAFASQIPGAIMSVFNTESTIHEVANSIQQTGVYFILMKSSDARINMPKQLIEAINQAVEMEEAQPQNDEMTIDDVLDQINRKGIASLTPAQRQILEGRQ